MVRLRAAQAAFVLVMAAAWEVLTRSGVLSNPALLPGSEVLRRVGELLGEAGTWSAMGQTLLSWLIGMAICAVIGVSVGGVLGWNRATYATFRLVLEFLRCTPPVVVIPFVLLFFGPTQEMKVILIVLGAVWPLLVQTMYGVHDLDPVLIQTVRAYRVRGARFVRSVVFPGVLPYVVTGLRVSAVMALLLTIASEMVTSTPGLGRAILYAQINGATSGMYALVLIAGVLGIVLNAGFDVLEKRALHWHPSRRARA